MDDKKQKMVNQEFVWKHITLNSRKLVERGPGALLNLSIVEKKNIYDYGKSRKGRSEYEY